MNIIEFINGGGKCRSISGHDFNLVEIDCNSPYPIKGYLQMDNFKYDCEWSVNGTPYNLPSTYQYYLKPLVRIENYVTVNSDELSNFKSVKEFQEHFENILEVD